MAADAEIARARKELADRHSVTVSRKANEFKEAESRIKAELAAVSTSLTDERAHRMELETVCCSSRRPCRACAARSLTQRS